MPAATSNPDNTVWLINSFAGRPAHLLALGNLDFQVDFLLVDLLGFLLDLRLDSLLADLLGFGLQVVDRRLGVVGLSEDPQGAAAAPNHHAATLAAP